MENSLDYNKGGGQLTCHSNMLRDYQKVALDFMVQKRAVLEYDDMG